VDGEGQNWTLQPGDVIAQINGTDVTTIEEFATAVRNSPYKMELVVVGNSDQQEHRFTTNVNPRLGVSPGETGGNKVQVVSVVPGSAATHCSDDQGRQWRLEVGDVITSINGQSINSTEQFRKAVASSLGKMTLIVVGTDGQSHELNVTLGD
jgi:S1-C subfamily serine protease